MLEVYEFLKSAGVYYLATVEGDQPRVRPFGTIDLYDDGLYIMNPGSIQNGEYGMIDIEPNGIMLIKMKN